MKSALPTGTVSFLFTDIEGSTQLLHELGVEAYSEVLGEHRRVLRDAFARHGGVEVGTEGDSFFVAFPTAPGAVAAASEGQESLSSGRVRVRMGVHTGNPRVVGGDYVGVDVHRAARIGAAGHGGQVLLSAATRQLAEAEVTDLGEHRLKDFEEPVRIFQLGSGSFPPLRTISNTNLPHPASSFVGREREVSEVVALLADGARLVTLTGPGGSGKTRLAIDAAAELVPVFKAGVFWVGLAALRDSTLVADAIASTVGAKNGLVGHIGDRDMLLLLDNLEQVIEAASQLSAVVEACPNLKLLVTSREVLRVRGEVEYPVLPLAESEAVELFCVRARTQPDEVVRRLCRALDNLPLALELAAARASVLSPHQILERLSKHLDLLKGGRDADPRQQTLRATIEWSYELLTPEEKALFARLAVFRGGSTLEAVEEVTDADLDALQSLVDKSLLRHTGERFWMLETIRAYASERLDDIGGADDRKRLHAQWFLALAEEAEPHLRRDSEEWVARLEAEHDNVRAALERLDAFGESQGLLRLAGAVSRFWYLRSHLAEGRRHLENALASDQHLTAARAKALNGAAVMAFMLGDMTSARLWAEEALTLHNTLGDVWGGAYSALMIGNASEGDDARAQAFYEESLRVFIELGDDHYALLATYNLTLIISNPDDPDVQRERARYEDILVRARGLGNRRLEMFALTELGGLVRFEGRFLEASSLFKKALRLSRDLGDPLALGQTLVRFARLLANEGRPETAIRLLSKSEALYEEIGATVPRWFVRHKDATVAEFSTQLDEAAIAKGWEQGRALSVDEAIALAITESM